MSITVPPEGPRHEQIALNKNLARLEKYLARGITNQVTLGAAFGVSQSVICGWIKKVYDFWKEESPKDLEEARFRRVHQIDAVAVMALNAFDRSKQDAEEITVTTVLCDRCSGQGIIIEDKATNKKKVCPKCVGDGNTYKETRKIRGQPGDPAFLNVAKSCFEASARLEGIQPNPTRMSARALVETSQVVGGEIQRKVEEIYYEAPVDTLIRAMVILDELKNGVKNGKVKRIIEVEAETIHEEPESDKENGDG